MDLVLAMERKGVKWLAIWGLWTLFGFLFASQVALQSRLSENPPPFWRVLLWQLLSGYLWFAISPVILLLGRRFPFQSGKWLTSIPVHFGASLMIAVSQLAIAAFVLPKLGYMRRFESASYLEIFQVFLIVNLHFSVAIYWGVVGIQQAIRYYRKNRERELRTSQLEARLATTRLQVLKMQLHPHFLFNTLNAISELIYRDSDSAERMIADLSDLLRMSLENLEVQEISLKQELEFLEKYLAIELTRFHDRLKVEMYIEPEVWDAIVPNMILQPLVENAIKHGIGPRSVGGKVTIKAARENDRLLISVSDNGIGLPERDTARLVEGVGISNTRRRLKHLYGDNQAFDLSNEKSSGVVVKLTIPFKKTAFAGPSLQTDDGRTGDELVGRLVLN